MEAALRVLTARSRLLSSATPLVHVREIPRRRVRHFSVNRAAICTNWSPQVLNDTMSRRELRGDLWPHVVRLQQSTRAIKEIER